jgi:mxaK protein
VRQRTIHFAFAAAAIGFGSIAAYHGLRLHRASQVNAAIATASVSGSEAGVAEAQFARALASSESGDSAAALQLYKALIQGGRADLKRAALYNLGNLHLREAMKSDEAARSLPLIELAKQSYRDLLRIDPADWDARYNLERALWLAPEMEEAAVNEPPAPTRRAISTAPGRSELP